MTLTLDTVPATPTTPEEWFAFYCDAAQRAERHADTASQETPYTVKSAIRAAEWYEIAARMRSHAADCLGWPVA